MRKFLVAALVLCAVVFTGSKAEAIVDVEARYWFTSLDANAKFTADSVVGTQFDLVDDLGIDDKKGFLEGRITLELGSSKLRYGYVPMKWSGSKTLTQSIVFAGTTYTASTQVDSELKLDYHRLGYEYDFIDALNNKLGVIFEVKYFDGSASLKADSLGFNKTESFKAPIPTVGIAAQVGLPFLFSVGGEVTGMTYGSSAYILDAEAGVNIKPMPFVLVSAGYRVFKLHVEQSDDMAEIKLKGPFVTLKADF